MAVTCAVEVITKSKAHEYLAANKGNRAFNLGHLRELKARQARGEWVFNGDSIRFDSAGALRDGQHRLMMITETNQPIEAVVVRGIDPASFITMDTGRKRNLADVLSIQGYANTHLLAGAIRQLYRYVTHRTLGSNISYEMLSEVFKKHQGLVESLAYVLALEEPPGAPGYRPLSIAAHFLFSQVSQEAAADFVERLVTGTRLEAGDPVHRLRGQLVDYAKVSTSKKGKPATNAIFDLYVVAWNAKQRGRQQKLPFRVPEKQPYIFGFPADLMEVARQEMSDIVNGDDDDQGQLDLVAA